VSIVGCGSSPPADVTRRIAVELGVSCIPPYSWVPRGPHEFLRERAERVGKHSVVETGLSWIASDQLQLCMSDDLAAIKQLKARYCRFLDNKDWLAWRSLFTDDFVGDTSEAGGVVIKGADNFVSFVRTHVGGPRKTTIHQVHAPELELISESTAKGIWAFEDFVRFAPGFSLHGYGHYHETYEKCEGSWRIKSSKFTRLREDIVTPLFSFYISDSLRNLLSKAFRPVAPQ